MIESNRGLGHKTLLPRPYRSVLKSRSAAAYTPAVTAIIASTEPSE